MFADAVIAAQASGSALVSFERVRIVLRGQDGLIAVDTVVDFPAGVDALALTLPVPIPLSAPSTGAPMQLSLEYSNAQGETVFRGGPAAVTVVDAGGAPPAPISIPVRYSGVGSEAVAVRITPRDGRALAGSTITFTAEAIGPDGSVLVGTPIFFSSEDPARATMTAPPPVARPASWPIGGPRVSPRPCSTAPRPRPSSRWTCRLRAWIW